MLVPSALTYHLRRFPLRAVTPLVSLALILASPCIGMGTGGAAEANLPSSEGRDWHKSFEGPEVYSAKIILRVSENEAKTGKLSVARMLVDDAGNIILCYFSDGGGILKYAPNGKRIFRVDNLKSHTADPDSCSFVEGDPDSLVMMEPHRMGADGQHVIFVDKEGKVKNVRGKGYGEYAKSRRIHTKPIKNGSGASHVGIFNRVTGKELFSFSREWPGGRLLGTVTIGEDRVGNIYCVSKFKPPYATVEDPILFAIQKFSKKGELLTRIWSPLSDPVWPYPDKIFSVDLEGNIYQIWWDEGEYYQVIKWTCGGS